MTIPTNCREWPFFVIPMPVTKDGKGPATVGIDAVAIEYEVWDQTLTSHSSHDSLPDAINDAIGSTVAFLTGGKP
jgi:hypothetical protein